MPGAESAKRDTAWATEGKPENGEENANGGGKAERKRGKGTEGAAEVSKIGEVGVKYLIAPWGQAFFPLAPAWWGGCSFFASPRCYVPLLCFCFYTTGQDTGPLSSFECGQDPHKTALGTVDVPDSFSIHKTSCSKRSIPMPSQVPCPLLKQDLICSNLGGGG